MDYKVILDDLSGISGKIKTWEKQGYAPTIEKDSVLENLRKIYSLLGTDTPTEVNTDNNAIEVYREDNGIESLMEFIRNSQAKFMAETTAQISEIKDALSKGIAFPQPTDNNAAIDFKPAEEAKPAEETKPAEEAKPAEEVKPIKEAKLMEEAKPAEETTPVVEIKVDLKPESVIKGFYSLSENLRMNVIHELFNGDTSKAELSVNKMCTLKTLEELLIYIEEHFNWSATSATAAELISTLAKKF